MPRFLQQTWSHEHAFPLILVISQCKTTSAYEEPKSSGNEYKNSLVVKINNLCFVLSFIIILKYFKCDMSTFIYTNTFNQYLYKEQGNLFQDLWNGFMVQKCVQKMHSSRYSNGRPSHMTLPFEYRTLILSGIQMVTNRGSSP